jgi:hypothetical protein
VLRALRELTDAGRLIRIGYGVYDRAEISPLTGRPMLAARGGLTGAAREALTNLGVAWDLTEWERAYNEGRSTQVPLNPAGHLTKGCLSRRFGHAGMPLRIER